MYHLFLIFFFGFTVAKNTDEFNYGQYIGVNKSYTVTKFYNSSEMYSFIGTCPDGYRCKLDCSLSMLKSPNCKRDRFLISRVGDVRLSGAKAYCGYRPLSFVSIGNKISFGMISSPSSPGGRFKCKVTAELAPKSTPSCRCGERKKSRIVGGDEILSNEYTMMAGIVDNRIETIHCGGVVISSRFIMTAAHCLTTINPTDVSVSVGQTYINNVLKERYEIDRFIIHEKYNRETYDYDIALIELKRAIQFSETVLPVCLPFKFMNKDLKNETVTLLGWGQTSPGGMLAEALRKVDVKVIDQKKCMASEENVTDRQICTYTPGKDSCQQDSGGPLLVTDASTGLLFSVGIISFGNMWCGTTGAAINSRLTTLLPWVVDKANDTFCRK